MKRTYHVSWKDEVPKQIHISNWLSFSPYLHTYWSISVFAFPPIKIRHVISHQINCLTYLHAHDFKREYYLYKRTVRFWEHQLFYPWIMAILLVAAQLRLKDLKNSWSRPIWLLFGQASTYLLMQGFNFRLKFFSDFYTLAVECCCKWNECLFPRVRT